MDFLDPTEMQELRASLGLWLRDHLPGFVDAGDTRALRRWHTLLFEGGWLGLSWPKEYGGRGLNALAEEVFYEELARAQAPPLVNVVGLNLVAPVIMEWGTEVQKRRYLPRILSGEDVWCQGFSEPNAGSDLAALSTRAAVAPGGFLVSGQKVWTSFGRIADWCFLLVRTGTADSRHKGISALAVDMRSRGIDVRPIRQITGDNDFSELFFDEVFVPEANLVGPLHSGWSVAMSMLGWERRMPIRGTDSQVETVFDALLAAAAELGPRLDSRSLRELAECYVDTQVVRANRYRTLGRILGGTFRTEEGSVEKVFLDATQENLRRLGLELTGLRGLREGLWPRLLMKALAEAVAGGSTEIQKNIIAERLLGLPR